jgi:hypothetical protein
LPLREIRLGPSRRIFPGPRRQKRRE